jgi:excisionase family DNA binding protein
MGEDLGILSVTEVAKLLGCSKAHVCNAINGRLKGLSPLPAIRLGRRRLIRLESLQSWLEQVEGVIIPDGIDAVGASKGDKIDA